MSVEDTIRSLPKAELHVHIVGSTRPETLLRLMNDSGLDYPYKTLRDLQDFYRFSDFLHFLDVYSMVNDAVTKESHYERLTYEMLQHQARCNVRHVEAIFSPWDHMHRGLDYGLMLDAINRGVRRAARDYRVSCLIRVDLVRNYGPEIGMKVLDKIEEKGENITAIDTGGTEHGIRPSIYRECYARAREMGLHTVAHQGEAAGPDYVWECLDQLKPERIGHGVTAAEDPELLNVIQRRGVAIECCPVSNLRTGAVKSLSEHPIRRFIDAGINVSVNSDDPPMFGTDMNNEYLKLHSDLGFTVPELFRVSLAAVESSFLPPDRKQALAAEFRVEYGRVQ